MDKYMVWSVIYLRNTGDIISAVQGVQDHRVLYGTETSEFVDSLQTITVNELPPNLHYYVVHNSDLVMLSEQEVYERKMYGKILTEEERLLNQLTPSYDEVAKAKDTIEMINLIQEVMI